MELLINNLPKLKRYRKEHWKAAELGTDTAAITELRSFVPLLQR